MATITTATPAFRIDPSLKEALPTVAQQERGSVADIIEALIRGYCQRHGLVISALPAIPVN